VARSPLDEADEATDLGVQSFARLQDGGLCQAIALAISFFKLGIQQQVNGGNEVRVCGSLEITGVPGKRF
jgi:hypothetical protein